jgi:hypothetical protein
MHEFKVGQSVRFEPNTWYYRNTTPGPYEVRKQLPERNGEFEYCVKSSNKAHERVATESQIRFTPGAPWGPCNPASPWGPAGPGGPGSPRSP